MRANERPVNAIKWIYDGAQSNHQAMGIKALWFDRSFSKATTQRYAESLSKAENPS